MIKTILHQIWNERKQNGWLFLELVAVSIFLWLAIDPLFVLISYDNIPKGYNYDNVYYVEFEDRRDAPKDNNDEGLRNDFEKAVNVVRSLPEVESYSVALNGNYPNSYNTNCPKYRADTAIAGANKMELQSSTYELYDFNGSDYFSMMKICDARTGDIMKKSTVNNAYGVYVSKSFALATYGTLDVEGKKLYTSQNNYPVTICGVFSDVQPMQYVEPMHLVIYLHNSNEAYSSLYGPFSGKRIYFRLKKGVDNDEFVENFTSAIVPRMGLKYKCFSHLQPLKERAIAAANEFGISGRYRIQIILSGFALFCAFLGIMSTYWVRASSRRMDIGLMRSLGATPNGVLCQFLIEGWLLVTIAFLLVLPLLLHKVYSLGFSDPLEKLMSMMYTPLLLPKNDAYLHNQPITHFIIVSVITYLFIMIIAAIGIIIPTRKIVHVQPSEALREE